VKTLSTVHVVEQWRATKTKKEGEREG